MIFMLNLQQNRKNALDKIPEMFVNCKKKFLLTGGFNLQKTLFSFLSN